MTDEIRRVQTVRRSDEPLPAETDASEIMVPGDERVTVDRSEAVDPAPGTTEVYHTTQTPAVQRRTVQETYTEEPVAYREQRGVTVVRTGRPEDDYVARRNSLIQIDRLIWLFLGFVEVIIAIRVVLKLIAANPNSGFASLIYGISQPFLLPFAGLTATPSAGGMVLEIPSLIAIVVYALLAAGLVKLLWALFDRPVTRA